MTVPRRFRDSWPVVITSAIATFAVLDPAMMWFAAAGRPAPSMPIRAGLVAAAAAVVVAMIAGRASIARTRWRATAWLLLTFVATIGAIAASWAVVKTDADSLLSLIFVALQLVVMPWIVFLAVLPVTSWSVGRAPDEGPAYFGVAGTSLLVVAFDLAIVCNPLSVGARNPSIYLVPFIVWLTVLAMILAAIALAMAARPKTIAKGVRGTSSVVAALLGVGALVLPWVVLRGAWKRIPSSTNAALFGATRASDGAVWIVGQRATVFRLESGASKLERIAVGVDERTEFYGACAAKDHVWIVGTTQLVLRSEDGGKRWVTEHVEPEGGELRSIWCDADGASLAVGRGGVILRRTPEGTWERRVVALPLEPYYVGVTGKDRDRFVISFDGPLLRSEDGGETFRTIAPPAYGGQFVSIGDDGALWVGSSSLRRSTDRGVTLGPNGTFFEWLPVLSAYHTGNESYAAIASAGGTTFVAGRYLMRVLEDGGRLVEEKAYDENETFGLAVDGAGRVIAVGELGTVLVREHP